MTTTDTNKRIAEMLGWAYCSHMGLWRVAGEPVFPHFTTDLNLTVREIEPKGWAWGVDNDGGHKACHAWVFTGDRHREEEADTPAEALALAFLAAMEAEKEE